MKSSKEDKKTNLFKNVWRKQRPNTPIRLVGEENANESDDDEHQQGDTTLSVIECNCLMPFPYEKWGVRCP